MSRRARASDGQLEASGGRDADVNRERLVFFLISCVGRRVTAKLRNNVTYEGILTSCACNTDWSLTLDNARQKGPEGVESEVISTMIVPGKSWMSVDADDVQSPQSFAETANLSNMHQGMQQADGEVAQRQVPGEDGAEERQAGARDQQHELDNQLGIAKVVDESIVTTPLEQSEIPAEKRKEAERLARELEGGIAQETEGRAEGEEIEEDETERNGKVSKNASALLPVTGKASGLELAHHDRAEALFPSGEGTRDQRVSEMKRINALNLEPAFQKPAEKNRMPPKQQASRVARPAQTELKAEFQQSLDAITSNVAKRGALSATAKSFQMNPNAKAFTLAGSPPSALQKAPPTGPPAPQQAAVPVPKQPAAAPAQQKSTDKPSMPLVDILDQFFQRAREEDPESQRLEWPEAKGPSYREVLGQPTQNMVPGPWPPQQPGQPPMQAQLPLQQQQPPQQQPFGHQQHQQPQQNPQQQLPQQLQQPQQPQQQQQPLPQQQQQQQQQQPPHRQQQPQPQQQPPQPQQQPQQQPRQSRGQQQQQPPPQQQQPQQQPQQPQNQPPPQQQQPQQQPQQQSQQPPPQQQQPPPQQQQQQPPQQQQQQQPQQQMQPQMQPPQPQQQGGAMDPMHTGMAVFQDPRTGQMQPMYPGPQMFPPPQGAQMMPQRPPNDGSQAQMTGQPGMVFPQTQMMHPMMPGDNRQPTGPGMTMGLPAGFPTGPQQMMVMPVMLAPGAQYGQSGSGFVTQAVPGQPDQQASLKQCSG